MPRYILQIAYDGTNYHGWQVQPDVVSIQEVLQEKIALLLRSPLKVTGSGRTDTGVHAFNQYAHFDFSEKLHPQFLKTLNGILPRDISVKKLLLAFDENFHTRHSAVSREYLYFIHTRKNPFLQRYSWFYYKPLDINAMNKASVYLLKHKDFTTFCKRGSQTKDNLCEIYFARWHKWKHGLVFKIEANRFLRSMVRFIVGTLVEVGTGKRPPENIDKILSLKNNKEAGVLAPPTGLFLSQVNYPKNSWKVIREL